MTLRYPMEAGGLDLDYVTFTPYEYRTNSEFARDTNPPSPASGADSVILYMPNSTPTVGNTQAWNEATYSGPIGAALKDLQAMAGRSIGSGGNAESIIEQLEKDFKNLQSDVEGNVGGLAGQAALMMAGAATGISPNQVLALGAGKIYNPNVELLYSGPSTRQFTFNFDMTPKNAPEAQMINRIILNFKKWASPGAADNPGMFSVPHIWQIQYKTGSDANTNLNRFKKAALKNISVVANQQTDMHVAHQGGVPISTSISLMFQEVDIITREDHIGVGGQGY